MTEPRKYQTFAQFYPFYLSQHRNKVCRLLHYIGSMLAAVILLYGLGTGQYWLLPVALCTGYAFAWIGHLFFEKNRPATFTYPLYSFAGDWKMLYLAILKGIRRKSAAKSQ